MFSLETHKANRSDDDQRKSLPESYDFHTAMTGSHVYRGAGGSVAIASYPGSSTGSLGTRLVDLSLVPSLSLHVRERGFDMF